MRFLPVNLTTLLVELDDLDQTLALFASLETDPVEGIEEIVPAARTLMIGFRAERLTAERLAGEIATRDLSARIAPSDQLVEIPVHYDGEDLADVAQLTGLSVEEVIRRHTESTFTVAFCGFAPGFGYLVGGDPALHVPRRQSPRTRIPAGSVALAGAFSGVYPQASPGGWQIIGTTLEKMWDLSRDPPALFQPGYRVRFFDLEKRTVAISTLATKVADAGPAEVSGGAVTLKVLAAPMPALFQDLGRFGKTGQGVSSSGALDRRALKAANRVVGNAAGTPCLEITLGGFSFEASGRTVMALTGAPCPISIRDASGRTIAAETYRPISLEPGDVVTLGHAPRGMRSYLSIRGGLTVEPVLGSASTDTLAFIGPDPVTAGTILTLQTATQSLGSVSLSEAPAFAFPASGEIVTLDVIMGPRSDWFTEAAITSFSGQLWQVTPQSNRVGIRLSGDIAIERKDKTELPSEGTATGAIQVPHSGQPVLFLADHPLTGGYPVIGTVAEYHLDLAGQIPVNAQIRFRPVTRFADVRPHVPDTKARPPRNK
ncbi:MULTISPECIES: 5-oxoprolinase/urea amidolyase family protein [Rhizobium]|uniref:5-oxoprolinase subunit B/C family protein n=1 Tax=Rhizobium TaxID=379 RepID=UPI00103D035F|nr:MULTISPECIES: 5-oxoprolinase/urea amidolyase family protein [Rhizobium]MBB3526733.1 KipI family sensor histidine kinase inhibitor [Rhizobium sp. BK456]MBY4588963.1 5-oxoprolinase/urea amidolyase family protein [Rhizobium redzepovicii]MBY4616510.1 5-oxoprolinase/urea amidolyase family protein [Rhizobium redzepovicii]MDR9785143.1 5-oxoprolinase/urea amidolyase family protein [Rhizobium redzepovicii]TBY48567.1 5-oxoprolinase/urea amidolyase family protein [Rhizobium leguminosarum bv. viciae]